MAAALTADEVSRLAQEQGFLVSGSDILRFHGQRLLGSASAELSILANIPATVTEAHVSAVRANRVLQIKPKSNLSPPTRERGVIPFVISVISAIATCAAVYSLCEDFGSMVNGIGKARFGLVAKQ